PPADQSGAVPPLPRLAVLSAHLLRGSLAGPFRPRPSDHVGTSGLHPQGAAAVPEVLLGGRVHPRCRGSDGAAAGRADAPRTRPGRVLRGLSPVGLSGGELLLPDGQRGGRGLRGGTAAVRCRCAHDPGPATGAAAARYGSEPGSVPGWAAFAP